MIRQRLRQDLKEARRPLHYLAIPPSLFATVGEGLAKSAAGTDARLVSRSPSAIIESRRANSIAFSTAFFPEENIFRIDHYLIMSSWE
jgi:glucose-6-phosphate 1-dehydrogenase